MCCEALTNCLADSLATPDPTLGQQPLNLTQDGFTLGGVGRIDTDARHAMAVLQLSACVMAELAKRSKVFDALAACVILQGFLDAQGA